MTILLIYFTMQIISYYIIKTILSCDIMYSPWEWKHVIICLKLSLLGLLGIIITLFLSDFDNFKSKPPKWL